MDICDYCEREIEGEPYKEDKESGCQYCSPPCRDEAVQLKRAQDANARESGTPAVMDYKRGRF